MRLNMIAVALLMLVGCDRPQPPKQMSQADVTKELDRLYHVYLSADVTMARVALFDCIRLLQKENIYPNGTAIGLYFAYSRLFVLEKRAGNTDIAEADLVKARYWYLTSKEGDGASQADAARKVVAFDAEKCESFVDEWDKKATKGAGPSYVHADSGTR